MKIRKLNDKKPYVVLVQGSPRDPDTCPNMISKTHKIIEYITQKWSSFFDFEIIDLSVNLEKKSIIQPCKGCVSTAGGIHCHFPCSCFKKDGTDLMKDLDVYEKLSKSDAFIILSPIHWHSLPSQLKTFFDRLVCANLTLRVEDAIKLMGKNKKNHKVTGRLLKSGKHNNMLRNHLEGKVCGFYVHGDDGATDYSDRELPDSYSDVISDSFSSDPKSTILSFILQMKYSGIYVPDDLVQAFYVNKDVDYYTSNIKFNKEFYERADQLMNNLLIFFEKNDY